MIDALYIAASGMQTQQTQVDTIANNLTNATTPAFKRSKVNFHDLINQVQDNATATNANARIGAGVGVTSIDLEFSPGDLKQTDSPYDLAIQGNGFLTVTLPDGSLGYSRGGTLKVDGDGFLATREGYVLKPGIQLPADASGMHIYADGRVEAQFANGQAAVELGQLELGNVSNPSALQNLGNGVYRPTEASGDVNTGKPGEDGMGTLVQGRLEGSNVKMVDEMVNLMLAQRAYEMGSKLIQTSDELMAMTNSLRR